MVELNRPRVDCDPPPPVRARRGEDPRGPRVLRRTRFRLHAFYLCAYRSRAELDRGEFDAPRSRRRGYPRCAQFARCARLACFRRRARSVCCNRDWRVVGQERSTGKQPDARRTYWPRQRRRDPRRLRAVAARCSRPHNPGGTRLAKIPLTGCKRAGRTAVTRRLRAPQRSWERHREGRIEPSIRRTRDRFLG